MDHLIIKETKMSTKHWISLSLIIFMIYLSACSATGTANTGILKASGTISVTSVQVAPEISGKILEIKVTKGDSVKTGDILFNMEDNLLQAQFDQANAAVAVAQANLDAAQQKLSGAQTQYDLAMQTVRKQDKATRISDWKSSPPDSATTGWYFQRDEKVTALKTLVEISQKDLANALVNLNSVLKSASSQDFLSVEKRLNQAEQMHDIAETTLKDAKLARDTDHIQDAAQDAADAAQTELDAAKNAYDQMLPSSEATKVMDARAKVAVNEINLINTQNALDREQTGNQSLQVVSAQSALDQANSAVKQANANLSQSQANLQVAKIQLDKAMVASPISGIVLSNPVNAGEVVAAGATVFEIGSLDQITLDVYISENQYGQVKLGQTASVKVDSFPNKSFEGKVTYISDQAEFTPRTVQTVESRSTTVYKVEITIANPDHDLKAGMPADATFTLSK
jgi:HlyD family secretion protein